MSTPNSFPVRMPIDTDCVSALLLRRLCADATIAIPKTSDNSEIAIELDTIRALLNDIVNNPQDYNIDAPGFFGFPIINDGPNYCKGSEQYELVANLLAKAKLIVERSGEEIPLPGPKFVWDNQDPVVVIRKVLDGTLELTSDVVKSILTSLWPILLVVGAVLVVVAVIQAKVKA